MNGNENGFKTTENLTLFSLTNIAIIAIIVFIVFIVIIVFFVCIVVGDTPSPWRERWYGGKTIFAFKS